jgi:hypothetical protein
MDSFFQAFGDDYMVQCQNGADVVSFLIEGCERLIAARNERARSCPFGLFAVIGDPARSEASGACRPGGVLHL